MLNQKNAKNMLSLGTLSLVAGLLVHLFAHPVSQVGKNLAEGTAGLLVGLGAAVIIMTSIKRRKTA